MEELNMYNANAFKVWLDNGQMAYIEEQEHISLMRIEGKDGCLGGEYYFMGLSERQIEFDVWDDDFDIYFGKILAYSHDYGNTWVEVE